MERIRENRLGLEKSPYLLQHKDNPVWWQPWGEGAFAQARAAGLPVFLSVGYSTCHWCHVMEHESFEDAEVAQFLNERFVSIKVDREERPDVDAIYMDAVHALNQRGGWPMSAFLTPDGQPFFAGTYFPKAHFLHLLGEISRLWTSDRERVLAAGAEVASVLERAARRGEAGELDAAPLHAFVDDWERQADEVHGGRAGAPKFPPAYDVRLLLRIHRRTGDARALAIATGTLDALARGGICDHLGGGFHRYSTDERWLVPHFEKMLYDQASLAGAFLDGFLVTGRREYELVLRETLEYVLRDLTHADGGFLSAEDADSEGEEGRFYVFTPAELEQALGAGDARLVADAFGVTPGGNFEHGWSVLSLQAGHDRASRSPELAQALRRLLEARGRRVRPHLDDKVLCDWNGLMIASMARAGRALGDAGYVTAATRAAAFVLERLRAGGGGGRASAGGGGGGPSAGGGGGASAGDGGGGLLHRWRDGEAAVPAFLDDHAFMVDALIECWHSTFDERWLRAALDLQRRQDALFFDEARGDYYSTAGDDPTLPLRRIDAWDNVTPAGRSVAALNLSRLADLLLDEDLRGRAARVLASTPREIQRVPAAFPCLLAALERELDRAPEIALVGPGATTQAAALFARAYLPGAVVAASEAPADWPPLLAGRAVEGGRTTAYVCERGACLRPTTDMAAALSTASRVAPL